MKIEDEYELDLEDTLKDLKQYIIPPDKLTLGQELGRGQFGSVRKAAYTTEMIGRFNRPRKGTVSTDMVAIKFLMGMCAASRVEGVRQGGWLGQELGRGQFGSVRKAAYTTELMGRFNKPRKGTVSTNMVAIKFLMGK